VTVDNGGLTDAANAEPDRVFNADRDPVRTGTPAEHQSTAHAGDLHLYSRGKTFLNCKTIDNAISVADEPPLRIKRKPDMVRANDPTSDRTTLQAEGCLR
jgi:hypothetical protein